MDEPQFTPTEERMLSILADGEPHTSEELHAALFDDYSQIGSVYVHVFRLRRKLIPLNQAILCVLVNGRPHYQHVKTLTYSS